METIISIAAICVTLLLGIVGIIVNSLIQRKSNSITVITQTRLSRREYTQKLVADLLKISDPFYIESLPSLEEKRRTIREATEIAANIRIKYCFAIREDEDLIRAAFEVKDILCKILLKKIKLDRAQLIKTRSTLAMNADVYTSTEWKRIKKETIGKGASGVKGLKEWTKTYNAYALTFPKTENARLFGEGENNNQ